jgi:probable phosphoglycerate mutase
MWFDGSCWPNPGPNSQCGFVLRFGQRIIEKTIFLGQGTNNTAEYHGCIEGLRAALEVGVTDLECYGDSQLVLNGVRRMRLSPKGKPHLEALKAQAIELARQFRKIEFIWIPREENSEADSLSTAGL